MSLTKFSDSAGREAYKDERGQVFTEGGKTSTGYNVDSWNQRQQNKYGGGQYQSAVPSSYTPGLDLGKNLAYTQSVYNQGMAPVTQALERSKQAAGQSFDVQDKYLKAQVEPMKARYDSIISTLKGNQGVAEKRQSIATTSELGRRGISMDSGVAQQQLADQVNPITESYAGEVTRTGLQGQQDLLNLANTIAQLTGTKASTLAGYDTQMANTGLSGLQNALSMANTLTTGAEQSRQYNATQANQAAILKAQQDAFGLGTNGTTEQMPGAPANPAKNYQIQGDWIWINGQWVPRNNSNALAQAMALSNPVPEQPSPMDQLGPLEKLGQIMSFDWGK